MRKFLASLLVIVLLAVCLASCNGGRNGHEISVDNYGGSGKNMTIYIDVDPSSVALGEVKPCTITRYVGANEDAESIKAGFICRNKKETYEVIYLFEIDKTVEHIATYSAAAEEWYLQ